MVSAPNGAPAVTFDRNGSNAAKDVTATFGMVGDYTFQVTISDANGSMTTRRLPPGGTDDGCAAVTDDDRSILDSNEALGGLYFAGDFGQLFFEAPDLERFPALNVARQAMEAGGAAPIVLNAANEVAVAAFLDRRIGLLAIVDTVNEALTRMDLPKPRSIAEVIDIDRQTRALANDLMSEMAA